MKKIFTVYDSKAEAYLQPFFLDTVGMAIRAVSDCVNDVNHNFCRHAEDYTLFELGSYVESKGVFELHASPVSIGKLQEFKAQFELPVDQPSLV